MPSNPKVTEIYQRKLLEWAGYTPDEINDIMQYEQEQRDLLMQQVEAQAQMGGGPAMTQGGAPALPQGGMPALPAGNMPPAPPMV